MDIYKGFMITSKHSAVMSPLFGEELSGAVLPGNPTELLVIDGQQRLTTLSLLLIALARAAKDNTAASLNFNEKKLLGLYLTNQFSEGELYYKLLLTQGDKKALMQLVDDVDHAKATLSPDRLLVNYEYFEKQLRQENVDLNTIYAGISKLTTVFIALGAEDNPQLIFESLNSTGMALPQADLIRNYILMCLNSHEQTKLYNKYWFPMEQQFNQGGDSSSFDRFMRDYLTVKLGTIPNIDKVYAEFKTYHRNVGLLTEELVKDVYKYAQYFVNIAFEQEKNPDIKEVLKDINILKVDVAYPFLLEVYDDYVNEKLTRSDFLTILRLVESYVFRRAICGIPTNGMNKMFATLAKEVVKEHYLESVQVAFLEKSAARRLPRDQEFQAALLVKDVYNFRSRNYLLRKLEESAHKKMLIDIDSSTIEHILPQKSPLSKEWKKELGSDWQSIQACHLHTIGNLTLTPYNSELSDLSFQKKRDKVPGGFKHTPLRLNEELGQLEHWGEAEIQQRASTLAEQALRVWSIPAMSQEQISTYRKKPPVTILAEVIGLVHHPEAGFVPDGFKIIQVGPKKWHYFRLMNGLWVQYGNGKDPWYSLTWGAAGKVLRNFDKKDIKPTGVGGPLRTSYKSSIDKDALLDESDSEEEE